MSRNYEIIRGMRDCAEGIEAAEGLSKDYYDGYSRQYTNEQNLNHRTDNGSKKT